MTSEIHEKTPSTPRVVATDRVLNVYVHDDAMMVVPRSEWAWALRYLDEDATRAGCSDRMMAAGICEDIRYLALHCTKEEAWHRLMQIRRAIRAYDRNDDQE